MEKQFGDLLVRRTELGLDIFLKDGEQLCFFNEKGTKALEEFIRENKVMSEINMTKSDECLKEEDIPEFVRTEELIDSLDNMIDRVAFSVEKAWCNIHDLTPKAKDVPVRPLAKNRILQVNSQLGDFITRLNDIKYGAKQINKLFSDIDDK